MPSLNSVTFDVSGFRFHEESDGERVWAMPAGDRGRAIRTIRP
jgi:hypothetical protein